jgi:hypothetical protein
VVGVNGFELEALSGRLSPAAEIPSAVEGHLPKKWSGRMDLNHRPPGPEPGALARLRYAPTDCGSKKETPLERTQKNSTARFGPFTFHCVFQLTTAPSSLHFHTFPLQKRFGFKQRLRFFTAALSGHPEDESAAPP